MSYYKYVIILMTKQLVCISWSSFLNMITIGELTQAAIKRIVQEEHLKYSTICNSHGAYT